MEPGQERELLKSLGRMAKALERQNDLTEKFYKHATRPRPLFMDCESGFRAGALSERLGLTDAEETDK